MVQAFELKTPNAPFNKQSKTSGTNKVEESRILLPMERWVYFGDIMTDEELKKFAQANKDEFLRLKLKDKDLRWLWIYLIGVASATVALTVGYSCLS